jgi:hypothetical protein
MSKVLETYLQRVDAYLAAATGREDIVAEIRSHITEKAQEEHAAMNEDTMERTLREYGDPRQVAERYLDGYQLISPAFKGHFYRYTLMLFGIHFAFSLLSVILEFRMAIFPFFYFPILAWWELVAFLPMIFLADAGLVGLVLMLLTRTRKSLHLPALSVRRFATGAGSLRPPRWPYLLVRAGVLVSIVYVYMWFGTVFFMSVNLEWPRSLFTPDASRFYSLLVIGLVGLSALVYAVRFAWNSRWVLVAQYAGFLVLLWLALNYSLEESFVTMPHAVLPALLTIVFKVFLVIAAVVTACALVKQLIRLVAGTRK